MSTLLSGDIFNLAQVVYEVARVHPNRTAVIEPDGFDSQGKRKYRRYTYEQLSAEAEAIAPGLREVGIAERTRIVCMTPPSFESCVIGLALQRVGATTLWIDPSVGYLNVGERLRRIQPEAFVGIPLANLGRLVFGWGPRRLKNVIITGRGFPGTHSLASLRRQAPEQPTQPNVSPEDPAAVLYTTGSTGPAKPTLYNHKNYAHLYRMAHESWRFDPEKKVPVDMAVFPAFFFIALSAGGTMVVPPIDFPRQSPAKADPKAMVEVINDCEVQSCFASPVILENMARYAVEHQVKTPTFTRVIGGGAPIYASVKKALLDMMGENGQVFSNYGATEALPTSEMDGRETLEECWPLTEQGAGICVGRPLTGVEIKIVRMSDDPIPTLDDAEELPTGEIGEILVKSRHVSPGYFLDEESTRKNKVFGPEGEIWHRLGDAGYLDAKGRIWYCGRVSQRVRGKDGPFFSLNCEPIFDAHPKVRRAGLVGVSRGAYEEPVICIELERGVPKSEQPQIHQELLAAAKSRPATKDIKQILFLKALPVDPRHNSKIERPKLGKTATRLLKNKLETEA